MTNKQPIQKINQMNKLAGKETSLQWVPRQKSESQPLEVSKKTDYIRSHVEHFVLCLRDAFGFRDPMEVVSEVTVRLNKEFPDCKIEKIFKWFYGNSLGWSSNNLHDVIGHPDVDALGLNSKDYYDSCKIFGGRLQVFLQKFFRRQSRHSKSESWKRKKSAFSKAQTFLMFKKGSPQVSQDLIKEADRKHREAMSNAHKARNFRKLLKQEMLMPVSLGETTSFEEINSIFEGGLWGDDTLVLDRPAEMQEAVELQAALIINRLFKPGSFKRVLGKEQTLFPSTSAHSEKGAKRSKGGAVNIVKDFFDTPVHTGELERMTFHPRTGVITHYKVSYPDATGRIASALLEDKFIATPVYLREPLKVRTITKGPSAPYWFFRPIQKFLWSTIQKHPVFELIGTPIKGELLDKMLPFVTDGCEWISGDYSAATDNLAAWLTRKIWTLICLRTGIPDEVCELGLKGLVEHQITYKNGEVIEQKNGQLMGSPLSFPILCIANASICLASFDSKRRNLDKVPLKVNGDDCVMSFNRREELTWREYAQFIGMSPSPGKCYRAKDWLQMNSELFLLKDGTFRQIPFINFSLASPNLAKGGQERTVESLSQTMQTFCFGKSPKMIDIWIRRMAPFLKKKVPGLISWYLPQCLGGLGLMTNHMSGDLFNTQQLKVATLFYKNGLAGKDYPYKIASTVGGKANYQILQTLKDITIRRPLVDENPKPVKSYWSERFFKERSEEEVITPLLWENLILSQRVFLSEVKSRDVLSYQVKKVFQEKSKRIEPMELSTLLRFRGIEASVPPEALYSCYEPKNVFLDVLVALTRKDREVLTSL